jgi:hypothetical protein
MNLQEPAGKESRGGNSAELSTQAWMEGGTVGNTCGTVCGIGAAGALSAYRYSTLVLA